VKCLVSGATGFIGRQLCQQLATRGDTVLALSKNGAPLNDQQATLALDLARSDPELTCFKDVDVVFHLAGIAHQQAPEAAYQSLNCDATLRLARIASDAGVRCFVFLSSVKAMGPPETTAARSESDVSTPPDPYGLSKWRAECALREAFLDDRMSIVIVRPALVYGMNAKGNLKTLAKYVRKGLPRPPQGGRRSMIALEDLVELLCVIAQRPPAGITTWIACGGESYTTREIYDLLRIAGGKGSGIGWLPRWAWRIGAQLLDLASGQSGQSSYDKLFGSELYNNAAVLAATQWQPRVRLADNIRRIALCERTES
jgi:nucleoside-diphosphate-sugar epimerase